MDNNLFEKKLAIACDHAGFDMKLMIIELAKKQGYEIWDFGTLTKDSVDYPDFVHPLCQEIEKSSVQYGVLICGSGNGVAITANKYPAVRAALCWNEEIATLAKKHNDANVLCIPARFVNDETATRIFLDFLSTPCEGGRHQIRVQKITTGLR